MDCCDGFLEFGRQDAKAAGISNITFLEEDVQTYPFEPIHDFCFSRFGTQFFENPVAGLRNMRKSLKPGGIMTMIVWRGIKDNPWLGSAKDVVLRFLPPPGENAQTCGPGPFSMADTGVVTKQLEIAGYRDIQFEQIDAQVFVGKDLDDALAFQLALRAGGRGLPRGGQTGGRSARRNRAGAEGAARQSSRSEWRDDGFQLLESDGHQSGVSDAKVMPFRA